MVTAEQEKWENKRIKAVREMKVADGESEVEKE